MKLVQRTQIVDQYEYKWFRALYVESKMQHHDTDLSSEVEFFFLGFGQSTYGKDELWRQLMYL